MNAIVLMVMLPAAAPVFAEQSIAAPRSMPADPKNDPSMVIGLKTGGIDYTIRAIDPPICNLAR